MADVGDVEQEVRNTRRGRRRGSRGRGRGGESSSRSRSGSRGRGRGRGKEAQPSKSDEERVKERREQKKQKMKEMQDHCLNPQVLALGQRYHREMLGRYNQRVENYNKSMRHSGYRNCVLWRHGRLGAGVRLVIPSGCVWKIRDTFLSATQQYTGFVPGRFI